MNVVRPAHSGDLEGIRRLVAGSDARISTLSEKDEKLAEKLLQVEKSFRGETAAGGADRFLFVLENTETGDILGTSGIDVSAGNGQPFYNYRQDDLIHASHTLGVSNRIPVLYLTHELTGQTLLCSLTLRSDLRQTADLALLSRSRLLFIQRFRKRFADRTIVEIQGVQTDDRQSPFWNSLGRHFFQMDFAQADHYSSVLSKTFIAELMPPHPIYVPLLTDAARAAIAQPHPAAKDVCQLLQKEGFRPGKHIDIFDGGPVLEANTDDLASVRECHSKEIKRGDATRGKVHLVCNSRLADFRCGLVQLNEVMGDVIRLPGAVADHLKLNDGDTIGSVLL